MPLTFSMPRSFSGSRTFSSGGGRSPYGSPVGQVPMPNPAGDLAKVYPNLGPLTAATSANVGSELSGKVSQNTLDALATAAAQRGVASGMPGLQPGSLASNGLFANIAGYSENRQRQGIQDYLASIAGIGKSMTVAPELQTEVNLQNAVNAAAPDPALAAAEEQRLFEKYFNLSRSPAGGTVLPWYQQGKNAQYGATVTRTPAMAGGVIGG